MLSEGAGRLAGNVLEAIVSSQGAGKITNKVGIKNPIAKLAVNIVASSFIDSALSFITNPLKKSLGFDKEMTAHSDAGKNFKKAIGIAGFAAPLLISDMQSLKKYGPILPLLGGGLLAYGVYANKQEEAERKRLGLLNRHSDSLQKISAPSAAAATAA